MQSCVAGVSSPRRGLVGPPTHKRTPARDSPLRPRLFLLRPLCPANPAGPEAAARLPGSAGRASAEAPSAAPQAGRLDQAGQVGGGSASLGISPVPSNPEFQQLTLRLRSLGSWGAFPQTPLCDTPVLSERSHRAGTPNLPSLHLAPGRAHLEFSYGTRDSPPSPCQSPLNLEH